MICYTDNSGRLPAVEELAEKYEDFATLVKISQGNTAKLKVYMNRFSAEVSDYCNLFILLIVCCYFYSTISLCVEHSKTLNCSIISPV